MSDPYDQDEWYEDDDYETYCQNYPEECDDEAEDWDTDGDYVPTGKVYAEPLPEGVEPEPGFSTHSFDDVTPPSPTEDDDHDHE